MKYFGYFCQQLLILSQHAWGCQANGDWLKMADVGLTLPTSAAAYSLWLMTNFLAGWPTAGLWVKFQIKMHP